MFFKRYVSEGLAHYSYLIADQGQAAVIDPRRDIDAYLQDVGKNKASIVLVLETHRNEDYLIGSSELEAATNTAVFHADSQWAYQYGKPVSDGQEWTVGRLKIRAIHTPGHTPGSMSYLLHDPEENPWILFSGDALFCGDAGRVDLFGEDHLEEMGGLLYASIFNKILPLGDSILLCPAHGAGSVCGSKISERTWTTIGMERQYNPKLQVNSSQEFIDLHAKILERPSYFLKMEALNLEGPPVLGQLPILTPLNVKSFEKSMRNSQVVDTRDQISFSAGFIPGSLSLWSQLLPNFAGWFLNYDQPILFICDPDKTDVIVRMMVRMGFDNLAGYLGEGVLAWALGGNRVDKIHGLSVEEFCQLMQSGEDHFILDIRSEDELEGQGLKHGKHISLVHLLEYLDELPKNQTIFPFCRSGNRSMVAASLLKQAGWEDVGMLLGGIRVWRAYGCDFEL